MTCYRQRVSGEAPTAQGVAPNEAGGRAGSSFCSFGCFSQERASSFWSFSVLAGDAGVRFAVWAIVAGGGQFVLQNCQFAARRRLGSEETDVVGGGWRGEATDASGDAAAGWEQAVS